MSEATGAGDGLPWRGVKFVSGCTATALLGNKFTILLGVLEYVRSYPNTCHL